MLSYIASNSTARLIKNICEEQNITILNGEVENVDFFKYIKETKVNFNLVKHLILDLSHLKNTDEEIINSVKYFKEMYVNTRIIILAQGFEEQNNILTSLYENGIYNIINTEEVKVKEEVKNALSEEGLQQKDVKKFKKIEVVKDDKKRKHRKSIFQLNRKLKKEYVVKEQNKKMETKQQISSSVYFFAILLEAITRLVKLICYCAIFVLTSIGLTILFNGELREILLQIFNQ